MFTFPTPVPLSQLSHYAAERHAQLEAVREHKAQVKKKTRARVRPEVVKAA
jgi:hypothetical protein